MNKVKDDLVDEVEVITQQANLQAIEAEYPRSLTVYQLSESRNPFVKFICIDSDLFMSPMLNDNHPTVAYSNGERTKVV